MTVTCRHEGLTRWWAEVATTSRSERIHWCDGSKEEYDRLLGLMAERGPAIPLKKRANSFLFRSDLSDVARIEARTYLSTPSLDDAGPTNNWIDPAELKTIMKGFFEGCMKGRTMFVIPFSMGPVGSPLAKIGVQISDSPYVVCNMHIMTRGGSRGLEARGHGGGL